MTVSLTSFGCIKYNSRCLWGRMHVLHAPSDLAVTIVGDLVPIQGSFGAPILRTSVYFCRFVLFSIMLGFSSLYIVGTPSILVPEALSLLLST